MPTPYLNTGVNATAHSNCDVKAIAQQLQKRYRIALTAVEPIQLSTENALFRIETREGFWILKLFKVCGNYSSGRIAEHTRYEGQLVRALVDLGVPTAAVHPTVDGGSMSTIDGYPALLFEQLPGTEIRHLDFSLGDIVPALARLHTDQLAQPLALDSDFHFDDACMIWLPLFHHYRFDTSVDSELSSVLNRLAPLVDALNAGERREALFFRSPAVHCHGDVAPRNILLDGAGVARLIDFNNAFYGPRIVDVIDGAFNFSGGNEKYFDAFVDHYRQAAPLSDEEAIDLPEWIALVGIMRLTKQLKILMSLREQQRYSRYLKRFQRVSEILSRYL